MGTPVRPPQPIKGDISRYAASCLQGELVKLSGLRDGDGRNTQLHKVSCELGQLLGGGVFESRGDLENLIYAGQTKFMAEPLEMREALQAINRGLDWGIAHPRPLRSIDGGPGL